MTELIRYVRFSASSNATQARGASADSSSLVVSVPLPRWEDYQGVSHLVIPVIALLGDIAIYPMGAECYELVPEMVLNSAPMSWNGHPILADHPNDGESGACTPEILSRDQFGIIFNSHYDDDSHSLQMEAWLNPERAMQVGQDAIDVFDRCAAGDVLEISVGAYIRLIQSHGVARNGREYDLAWTLIHPDHLAIGLGGKEGACSNQEGCGTNRVLTEGEMEEDTVTATNITKSIEKAKSEGKAGAGKHQILSRLMSSIRSLMSMMPADQAEEAGELIGYELMKSLSDSAKSHLTQMDAQIASLIAGEVETPTETREDEDAEEVMEDARLQAIKSYCYAAMASIGGILDQASNMRYDGYGYGGYASGSPLAGIGAKAFDLGARSAAGKRNSKKDQEELQKAHDHLANAGAECSPDNMPKNMSSGTQKSPCGCAKLPTNVGEKEDEEMAIEKEAMKALMGRLLSGKGTPEDAVLIKAEYGVETPKEAAQTAPVATITPVAAAVAKTVKTEAELEAEYLASAPPSVRNMVERAKAAEAEARTGMIRQLTGAQTHYNEAALALMDTNSLAGLVTVLKLNEPTPRVNYLGLGLPQPGGGAEDEAAALKVYGAPPSGIAEYTAAASGKQKAN